MSTYLLLRHNLQKNGNELARRLERVSITTIQRLALGGITTIAKLQATKGRGLRQHPFFLDQTEINAINRELERANLPPLASANP